MTGVLAEQLKLDGILNTKKIFSTEKMLLRASSFLFQIKQTAIVTKLLLILWSDP